MAFDWLEFIIKIITLKVPAVVPIFITLLLANQNTRGQWHFPIATSRHFKSQRKLFRVAFRSK